MADHRKNLIHQEIKSPSRLEAILVAAMLLVTLVAPLIKRECFPFSSTPMFAWPLESLYTWSLTNADGVKLDENTYRIRTNPNFYLEADYAVKYPSSVSHPPDLMPQLDDMTREIARLGVQNSERFPLRLIGSRCYVDGNGVAKQELVVDTMISSNGR